MYFPYLHGRMAELSALRANATMLGAPQQIVPIIHPVRADPSKLQLALADLHAAGAYAYVVVNPQHDNLSQAPVRRQWMSPLALMFADAAIVRPVLDVVSGTPSAAVAAFASAHTGRKTGIILRDSQLGPQQVAAVLVARVVNC